MSEWIERQAASRAACLAEWPEAENGAYDPRCCRFPKSCSVEELPFHPHDPRRCPDGLTIGECLDAHRPVDTTEVLEADDTVPVERLAHWLHGEFGGPEPWAGCAERTRENYRRTARALMSQLPELFR